MICKHYQAPPKKEDGVYIAYNDKGEKIRAGPWKGELQGWCRHISPRAVDGCPFKNDTKVECPIK
jgi:hypothetical protein